MKLAVYQIDAFANQVFAGNPAVVIPLTQWLSDKQMQSIAEENNLSETAFYVPNNEGFHIRWFTPASEVKLCGHATLATAFVLFNILAYKGDSITFDSLSGPLYVYRKESLLTLDFPAQVPDRCEAPTDLIKGLGKRPLECLCSKDHIAIFEREEEITNIVPNFDHLKRLNLQGVIISAPGREYDFVARFFAPKYGILEDPVTGSAYTQLTPYWADKLNKTQLKAKQVSARGGELFCEHKGDRTLISGAAVKYLEGEIEI